VAADSAEEGSWRASNPLLLTILYLVSLRGGPLPVRRVELYAAIVDTLLREWPAHRLGRRLDPSTSREALEGIARDLIERGDDDIGERELMSRLDERLRADGLDAETARARALELLRLVEETAGFFVEVGRTAGERRFGFLHRTFTEYLAVLALAETWESDGLDWQALLYDARWVEVVPLLFGHVGSGSRARSTRLLREAKAEARTAEAMSQGGTRLVLRALADGTPVDPGFRDEVVGEAIGVCLASPLSPLVVNVARRLVAMARTQPLGPRAGLLASHAGDDTHTALRRALLAVLIEPPADGPLSRLGLLLDELPEDAGSVALLAEATAALAESPPSSRKAPFVLLMGDRARALADGLGQALVAAGWPTLDPAAAARDPRVRDPARRLLILDLREWQPTVASFLEVVGGRPDDLELEHVIPDLGWHVEHRRELAGLAERADELPVAFADIAVRYSAYADTVEAWEPVRQALALRGRAEVRIAVLESFVERGASEFDLIGEAALLDADPVVRYAVVRPAWEYGHAAGNAGWLLPAARRLLATEHVDWVRGAALRTILELDEEVNPFAVLVDPDAFVFPPASTALVERIDGVIKVLALAAARAAPHEGPRLVDAAVTMLDHAPEPHSDWPWPSDVTYPVYREIADRCLQSPVATARRSGIALLEGIPYEGPRGPLIARLLADLDEQVRIDAAPLVRQADAADEDALADMMLAVLTHGPTWAAYVFAEELAEGVTDPAVHAAVRTLLDAYAQDHPDSLNAAHFALRYLPY
jgi:hypothetical protein